MIGSLNISAGPPAAALASRAPVARPVARAPEPVTASPAVSSPATSPGGLPHRVVVSAQPSASAQPAPSVQIEALARPHRDISVTGMIEVSGYDAALLMLKSAYRVVGTVIDVRG